MLPLQSPPRSYVRVAVFISLAGAAVAGASCAKSAGPNDGSAFGTSGSGSSGGVAASGAGTSGSGPILSAGGGASGSGGPTLTGGAGTCGGACTDFPAAPIVPMNDNVPTNASSLFGSAGNGNSSGGPCLYEPTVSSGNSPGSLFPNNWLRPIFEFTPPTGQDLFEIRIHSSAEANDLVVYTSKTRWTMPKNIWTGLSTNAVGVPLTVSVRGVSANGGTPSLGTKGDFKIAPAAAAGAMIFWSTSELNQLTATTNLQGFQVGDEGTTSVLTPWQVQQQVWAGPGDGGPFPTTYPRPPEPVACIGCHTSTPDGDFVAFTAQWPWPNAVASVQADAGAPVGAAPPWLTQSAIDNLGPNTGDTNWAGPQDVGSFGSTNNVNAIMLGPQAFSKAHYTTGDRIDITSVGASQNRKQNTDGTYTAWEATGVTTQLIWVDLEFTGATDGGRPSAIPGVPDNGGWGVLARTGDTNSAAAPTWSHDGNTIAYTSVNEGTADGRLTTPASGSADIMTIPYNNKLGGAATAVMGGSDPNYNEYYPAYSPDDSLIAYNRVDKALEMYEQPKAEVFVTAAAHGAATRLAANDPPSCQGLASPGVSNTWPKWAPDAVTANDGNTYYWVTFSSTRSPDAYDSTAMQGRPQLYVAAVVKDSMGNITTYPAIYLWNQDPTANNLIPAWDNFAIAHGTTSPPPR